MLDNKKISELYDAHAKELIIYIYSFVKSQETAEDILHDTFIRLLKYAKSDSITDNNLRAMLYKIARNICIDYIRKKNRRRETELTDNLEVSDSGLVEVINTRDLNDKINAFLENCDPVSRSVFIMKKELLFTFESIAERLNISVRTAKRKMQKITENLIDELKKCDFLK
jgi:RNA polymerase sigma factor (sigma-70 family)